MRSAAARRAGPGGGAARGGPHLGGCGSAARRRTRGRPRGRRRGPAASSHPPAPRGRGSGPTPAGSGSGSGHDRLPSRSPSQSAEAQARAPPPAASGSAGAGPGCGDEASADHQALPKEEDAPNETLKSRHEIIFFNVDVKGNPGRHAKDISWGVFAAVRCVMETASCRDGHCSHRPCTSVRGAGEEDGRF
ncbi:laforin-like isoform X4 [Pongo pygmaeus]|uniref:laforin-like isoform X4 n=1 Tax=Pongo pygmaeus TaxID=9600 RepID=UPI00300C9E14